MDKKDEELIEAIKALSAEKDNSVGNVVTHKNVNVLIMGVLAAVGALVWNTVVSAPANFGHLSQQNTEIRSTVLEMKDAVSSLSGKIDSLQKETGDQNARLTSLEAQTQQNASSIERNTDRLNDLERRR